MNKEALRKRRPNKLKETHMTNEKYMKGNKINQKHEGKKIRTAIKVREGIIQKTEQNKQKENARNIIS